jgi:hypothetical protein
LYNKEQGLRTVAAIDLDIDWEIVMLIGRLLMISFSILLTISSIIFIFATTHADTYLVIEAQEMNTSIENIKPYIDNFENWKQWAPWVGTDSGMTARTEINSGSNTSTLYWENTASGSAKIELIEHQENEYNLYRLTFFEIENSSDMQIMSRQIDEKTTITISINGYNDLYDRLHWFYNNTEFKIHKRLRTSLAKLKKLSEKQAQEQHL